MNTIRMTSKQFAEIQETLLADEKEAAVFLLAGIYRNTVGVHLVVRDVVKPEPEDYDYQGKYHLQVSPIFFNRVIGRAEALDVTIIQCHSHPFSNNDLWYSQTDDFGESRSAKTIHECLDKPMGSLLFGQNKVIGRIWMSHDSEPIQLDQMRLVDRRLRIKWLCEQPTTKIDTKIYDRQILAFGLKGQKLLSQLKVGIIGLGGTGSAVAEQLARGGITDYIIIDHDKFESSNKTRLYGSWASDTNPYKTEIIRRNILSIQPNAKVASIEKRITTENDLEILKDCDIIFSCTDKHAPRSLLNNFSYQYYIPIIDVGIGIDAQNNSIIGGQVRATMIAPSLPCLFCIGIINPEIILAESLPKEERKKRQELGYVVGLEDDVPSVVEVTSMAASYGILLLKDMLFGIIDTQANTVTLNITTFQSNRLVASIRPDCICQCRLAKGFWKKVMTR